MSAAACPPGPARLLEHVPFDGLRRIAASHQRAHRLLAEARQLLCERAGLEAMLRRLCDGDEEALRDLREASGLLALDSVLSTAGAEIAAASGPGAGGGPRPWPDSAWPLDDTAFG